MELLALIIFGLLLTFGVATSARYAEPEDLRPWKHCPDCQYSLEDLREGAPCPECGLNNPTQAPPRRSRAATAIAKAVMILSGAPLAAITTFGVAVLCLAASDELRQRQGRAPEYEEAVALFCAPALALNITYLAARRLKLSFKRIIPLLVVGTPAASIAAAFIQPQWLALDQSNAPTLIITATITINLALAFTLTRIPPSTKQPQHNPT